MGRTPAGRGKVRFEWEVKPHGTAFDGTVWYRSTALDTGVPGSQGCRVWNDQLISGLQPDRPYHWRLRTISSSPFFPHSPWMSHPEAEASQVHFRTRPSTCDVTYTTVGVGVAGTGSFVPTLGGNGSSCSTGGYGWQVSNALGGGIGIMAIGFSPVSIPLFGGFLYTSADSISVMLLGGTLGVPGAGLTSASLGFDLYPYAGITLHLQGAVFDSGAVQGFALTNGLRLNINP